MFWALAPLAKKFSTSDITTVKIMATPAPLLGHAHLLKSKTTIFDRKVIA